ncbi:MAG: DUF3276 family protein [Bacteroidales bacterium]
MEEMENNDKRHDQGFDDKQDHGSGEDRQEIFSETVRAGKRTYFFDVKATRAGEYYLTITESKRRFSNDQAKFFYEKHKVFLYKEDFEKFRMGLNTAIDFIQSGQVPEAKTSDSKPAEHPHADIDFEDLGDGGENSTQGDPEVKEE